jgi:hypothetical protein
VNVDLIIAGRRIRLQCGDGITLRPDERFRAFIAASRPVEAMMDDAEKGAAEEPGAAAGACQPDLTVDVLSRKAIIPSDAMKVFDARLMEETPEGLIDSGEPFWEVLTGPGVTYAKVWPRDSIHNPVIVMPHGKMDWQIYAESEGDPIDPLPYPVDGLLLYFLSSAMGDIMIHGSGVICGGSGWIFTGRSGSGKTTIAGIFDRAGDRVIHDDRLILRRDAAGWVMHSTPVYRNDEPRSAAIDHLWGIMHGRANVSTPVTGAEAVAMVMSNCIQQNWDREAALRLASSAGELVSAVRISRLSFMPDSSIRDYLTARESESHVTAADAASAILSEERPVTITAGGYSMWPAVRPGDRVVIEPLRGHMPAQGDIVALRRDGGYVVHRVRKITLSGSRQLYLTQGDAVLHSDTPSDITTIAGIVKRISRTGREMDPPLRRLPAFLNYTTSLIARYLRKVR